MLDFLLLLQEYRTLFLTDFFNIVSFCAETYFLLAFMFFMFWFIDKKRGRILMFSAIFSLGVNFTLKGIFHVLRPFVRNSAIIPLRLETATGYSFPSGHTQAFSNFAFTGAQLIKKTWFWILCSVLVLLVAFSRMYLGVHTVLDVGVAILVALPIALVAPIFTEWSLSCRFNYPMVLAAVLLSAATIYYGGVNYINIAAMMPAYAIGIYLDKETVDFEAKGKPLQHILKLLIGLGGAAVLLGPLEFLLPENHLLTFIGYFLLGLWFTFFAPCLFVKLKLSKSLKGERQ